MRLLSCVFRGDEYLGQLSDFLYLVSCVAVPWMLCPNSWEMLSKLDINTLGPRACLSNIIYTAERLIEPNLRDIKSKYNTMLLGF